MGAVALAFVAGIVSFTSPCCLPLMPGYVSYLTGVAGDVPGTVAVRSRVISASVLFVVGFSTVFTILGASASALGGVILANRPAFMAIAGTFVIQMGLATMGVLRIPLLHRQMRLDLHRIRGGPAGAVPLGMAFALGWTPCIGPVLAGILTAAATTRSLWTGAALLFVYSLGLGVPFVLVAIGFARADRAFGWLRRHGRAIERIGGAILVLMGILMITGQWTLLFIPLIRWFARNQWPPI